MSQQAASRLIWLACALVLLFIAAGNLFGYDMFWHLQTGYDIWSGEDIQHDRFSFSMAGEPVHVAAFLFDLALVPLSSLFGDALGLRAAKAVLWLACAGLLFSFSQRQRLTWEAHALLAGLLLAVFAMLHTLRPEQASMPLMLGLLMFLLTAQHRSFKRTACGCALLLWLWSNIHATAVFAYLIVASWYLDTALAWWRKAVWAQHWRSWLIWGVITLAVGSVRVGWGHPLLDVLLFDSAAWGRNISEFQSFSYWDMPLFFWCAVLLGFLLLAYLFRLRRFFLITVLLVFVWQGSRVFKVNYHLLLLSLPLFACMLAQPSWRGVWHRRGLLAMAVLCWGTILSYLPDFYRQEGRYTQRYPVAVVDYLQHSHASGKLINDYAAGGFLLRQLHDHMQVFIDGRTNILYPAGLMRQGAEMRASPGAFSLYADQHAVNWVLSSVNSMGYVRSSLRSGWALDFAENGWYLVSRTGRFPLLSILMQRPDCLQQLPWSRLQQEGALSQQAGKDLRHYASWAMRLHQDARLARQTNDEQAVHTDAVRALLAYWALRQQDAAAALYWLEQVDNNRLELRYLRWRAASMQRQQPMAMNWLPGETPSWKALLAANPWPYLWGMWSQHRDLFSFPLPQPPLLACTDLKLIQ